MAKSIPGFRLYECEQNEKIVSREFGRAGTWKLNAEKINSTAQLGLDNKRLTMGKLIQLIGIILLFSVDLSGFEYI